MLLYVIIAYMSLIRKRASSSFISPWSNGVPPGSQELHLCLLFESTQSHGSSATGRASPPADSQPSRRCGRSGRDTYIQGCISCTWLSHTHISYFNPYRIVTSWSIFAAYTKQVAATRQNRNEVEGSRALACFSHFVFFLLRKLLPTVP